MSEEAIYKLHRYPSGELEEFEYVQELVRCKECKWCDDGNGANRALICTNEHIDIDCHPDFYCGYGERSSE